MKKLLLITALFGLCSTTASAQGASTPTVVVDTVHYYFNKYYFKTGTLMKSFPKYESPAASATAVTHVGVKFDNNEPIEIKGLEGFMTRKYDATKLVIPVHLYLCYIGSDNLPVLPPIDSVLVQITGDSTFVAPVGGNFPNGRTHLLTTDFAVLARNMSLSSGDTVLIMRTAGKTFTAMGPPQHEKNSDGYGYLRVKTGNTVGFHKTTNFPADGFGMGTDYEFCLAPRVQYTLTADHAYDAHGPDAPLCTWAPMEVTSLASKRFMHRQYNLVEFARKWSWMPPFNPNTLKIQTVNGLEDVFPADSSVLWYFAPEDNLQDKPHPRFFLSPYSTTGKMSFYTDSAGMKADGVTDSVVCFTTNEFRTRFKPMNIYGRGAFLAYHDTFIICTSYCGKPYVVGIKNDNGFESMQVFPNPSTGKMTITGLTAECELRVYNIVGELILVRKPGMERTVIDLGQQPAGSYIVRVTDGDRSRTVRVIRE